MRPPVLLPCLADILLSQARDCYSHLAYICLCNRPQPVLSVHPPPCLLLSIAHRRSADYASSGATAFHPGTSPFHHQHAGLRLLGAHSGSGTAVGGSAHIGGSAHGGSNDDLLRLLDSVQRQRNEHRKLQRLSLDTSGHGGTKYWAAVGQQVRGGGGQ
jgi:hypothetical protein